MYKRRHHELRVLAAAASATVALFAAADAPGQTFTWINANGGTFNVASNWSPAGGPPNSATKSALFGPASLFNVHFTGSITNQHLIFGTSFAAFLGNGAATTPTYSLAGNATLSSGLLAVGNTNVPLNISVADQLTVTNSALNVTSGSQFTAARMTFAPTSGNSGTITVSGAGSRFNLTGGTNTFIGSGASSGTAQFTLSNGAVGTFSGPLGVAHSSMQNQHAALHVLSGASLTTHSHIAVGGAGGTGQIGQIFLQGAGSRMTQSGAGTILIGRSAGSRGIIELAAGTTFTSGTGTITVDPRGAISVIGGHFRANGTLTTSRLGPFASLLEVDGGTLFVNGPATLNGGAIEIGQSPVGSGGGTVHFAGSLTVSEETRISGVNGRLSAASLTLGGGSTLTLSGSSGSFSTNAASLTAGSLFEMSGGAGTFNSTLSVAGAGTQFRITNTSFAIGGPASFTSGGTGVITGGTFTFGNPLTVSDSSSLSTTNTPFTSGPVNLSNLSAVSVSNGAATINGALTVSGGSTATFDTGPLRITGPVSLFSGELKFLNGAGTLSSTLTLDFAGRMELSNASLLASGTLLVNGSQIDVGPNATFNSATATRITNGTFSMTGGIATFANSFVPNNSLISVGHNSTLVIPPGDRTFDSGTLALSGSGTINLTGANLTFTNNAVLSINSFLQPGDLITFRDSARMIGTSGQFTIHGTTRFLDSSRGTLSSVRVGGDAPGLLLLDGPLVSVQTSGSLVASAFGLADIRNGASLTSNHLAVSGGEMIVHLGGRAASTDRLSIGDINGNGSLTVTGPGTTLDIANRAGIGGLLNITNGASVTIKNTISFSSGGVINLSSGTFLADGSMIVSGNGAVFRKTGGVFHMDIAHILEVREGGLAEFLDGVHVSQTSNIFKVSDGGTLRFPDGVRLGQFGVFGASSGTGSITVIGNATSLSIGAGGATAGFGAGGRGTIEFILGGRGTIHGSAHFGVNGSSGTLLINSGAAPVLGDVVLGVNGGTGTAILGGSTFSGATTPIFGNLTIGGTGTGSFMLMPLGDSVAASQTGAASITIGAAAPGAVTGTFSINGGSFTSGTGPITVRPGGRLHIDAGRLIARGHMIDHGENVLIRFSGRLDLTDQTRFIDYTGPSPIASVRQQLVSGYANGAWNGVGIMSSTAAGSADFALGFAEASHLFTTFPATFQGRPVDADTILITYTRYGDANLDGIVNLQDFNRLAANFGSTNALWSMGDFNYDGIVNLSDFNRLAANFGIAATGPEVTPGDWSVLAAAVPEPAGLAAVCLATAAVMLRRRRR